MKSLERESSTVKKMIQSQYAMRTGESPGGTIGKKWADPPFKGATKWQNG